MVLQQSAQTEALNDLDAFIQSVMADTKVPGMGVAIVKDGEVLLAQGFGKRNVAENLDVTSQTLFAIASSTKAFTALALAMLVDEGKLDWNVPVRHYIPTFKLHNPVASEFVTSRDLLIHSTGLPRYDITWYNAAISRKEVIERLQYLEPNYDLRETWQYQNMMYAAAGYLVEAVTGQTWETFVQQRILEPLGMTSTNFTMLDSQQTPDYALAYKEIEGKAQQIDLYARFQAIAPCGALNSHVDDMAKWLLALLNKGRYGDGEQSLLSEKQFAYYTSPQIVTPNLPTLYTKYEEIFHWTYALGWFVSSYRGHTMIQHGGNIDGFSSLVTFLPDDQIGVVILTNLDGNISTETVTFNICDRLLGLNELPWHERFQQRVAELKALKKKTDEAELAGRIPDTTPSHPLSAYTGAFAHPGYGTFTIKLDGDTLKGYYNDLEYSFDHHHYDVFIVSQPSIDLQRRGSFSADLKGEIATFSIGLGLEPGVKPYVFTRVPAKTDEPTPVA